MPLTSSRILVICGLIAPSIAIAEEPVLLRTSQSISSESIEAWTALHPAYRVSVVQFAVNGIPFPDLYEMVIRRDGGLMLSVSALVELAEGSIYSRSEDSIGFYIASPSETIEVSLSKGEVRHGGKEYALVSDDWVVIDGVEYISYQLISRLAPLKATFREAEGIVEIETARPWPRQQRRLRELQWSRLSNRPPGETISSIPLALSYELTGAPQADISLSWRKDSTGRAVSEYSLSAVSEALYLTNFISLSGSLESGPSSLRLQTGRTDPSGSVFGVSGLYQIQAGDVTGPSLPVIGGIAAGRGIRLRAAPLEQDQGFDQTDISGDAPAGWDLELYIGGGLYSVGRVGQDGQYLFKDVPLRYGNNDFRVVMYGPNGQTREQTFLKTVGGNMLRPNDLHMYGYLVQSGQRMFNFDQEQQTDSSGLVGVMKVDYGLSADLTLSSFFARSAYTADSDSLAVQKELKSNYAGFEARTALNIADVEAGVVKQLDGGSGAYTRIGIPVGALSLNSSFNYYGPGFYSSSNQYGSDWIMRRLRVRSNFNVKGSHGGGFVGLSVEKIDLYSKSAAILASLSFSHRLGSMYLNHNVDAEHYKNALLRSSSRQVRYRGLTSTRLADVGLRSEMKYQLSGVNQGFESLGLNASWARSSDVSINGSYFYVNGGHSTMEFSVSKRFNDVLLSLSLIRSDSSRYSLSAGVSFSLGYTPGVGASFSGEQRAAYSQAKIRVFHDKNGDGDFDQATDEAIQNANIILNGIGSGVASDASGIIRLNKLPTNVAQNIRINSEELSDVFLVPKVPSFQFNARQGQIHYIPFPVTDMGEISGSVGYADAESEFKPLGNIGLQILSEDGTVFQETTTLSDGYYAFDKVFSGVWVIRLSPRQIGSFKNLSMAPKTVQLNKDGLTLSGLKLMVVD